MTSKARKAIGITGNAFRLPQGSKENTGNIIHSNAAKLLFTDACEVRIDSSDENIEYIQNTCSHLGFAAATMLCLNSPPWLDRLTEIALFIQKVGLPVVVFGVGNSTEKSHIAISEAVVDDRSINLLRVLSEYAVSIAVRGEFTADLCRKYDVNNIDVLGCQSIYYAASLHGPNSFGHRDNCGKYVASTTPSLDLVDTLDFCIENNIDIIGQDEHIEQDIRDNYLNSNLQECYHLATKLPASVQNFLRRDTIGPERYIEYLAQHYHKFYDIESWIEHIKLNYDFAFGSRFHGNVAALISGVPALWLTHDIRTIELCQHFSLPALPFTELKSFTNVNALREIASYSAFTSRFPKRIDEFFSFLQKNNVYDLLNREFVDGLSAWRLHKIC